MDRNTIYQQAVAIL